VAGDGLTWLGSTPTPRPEEDQSMSEISTKEQVDEAVREGEKYADDMAANLKGHDVAIWPYVLTAESDAGDLAAIRGRAKEQRWREHYSAAERAARARGHEFYEEINRGVARDPFAPIVKGTAK
jgi:hypothetical protein